MKRFRTHYDNLQVQEQASPEVIKAAWQALREKWRPERHPHRVEYAQQMTQLIDQAYTVLGDPGRRELHDAWIHAQRDFIDVTEPAPVHGYTVGAARRRSRTTSLPLIAVAWVLTFALIWWLFDDFLERREFPNRNITVAEGSATELVLRRNHVGHYLAPGTINGEPVVFLLDTGATQVSVPAHLADDLGLQPGMRGRALTANGTVEIRHTRINELGLGPFVLGNVPGHINPGMRSDQVLLGMSALRHLEFTQRGEHLILRIPSK